MIYYLYLFVFLDPFLRQASASDVDSLMLSYSLSGGYPLNTTINDDVSNCQQNR